MVSAELVVSLVGFAVTWTALAYKFGRIEGRLTQQLQEHERRLNAVDRRQPAPYVGV